MLDENLKPWVLEVNISPSLHSSSPLDISIQGQMIRDLLNLAGFVLEDILSSSSSPSSFSGSSTSLPSSPKEHFTAQKMKKAYYLTQKIPDQDLYSSVLDVLTPDDVRVLVEMEDEFSRRGNTVGTEVPWKQAQRSRSTQGLPVFKYSGQSSRLSASSASQSVADSLLTAVNP